MSIGPSVAYSMNVADVVGVVVSVGFASVSDPSIFSCRWERPGCFALVYFP